MLVYEYVNNGNLEQWLHGDVGPCSPLTWEIRTNIILGTAKGYTSNQVLRLCKYQLLAFSGFIHLQLHLHSSHNQTLMQVNLPPWRTRTENSPPWRKIKQHSAWQAMESQNFRLWSCEATLLGEKLYCNPCAGNIWVCRPPSLCGCLYMFRLQVYSCFHFENSFVAM